MNDKSTESTKTTEPEKTMEEKLGVYKNIQYSGEKTKDNHKLYYATCSVCGKTVKRSRWCD